MTTAELSEALTAVKTNVSPGYGPGGTAAYVLSLVNSGDTPLAVTVTDDLGGYEYNGATVYPLAYVSDSLRYYADGVLQAAPGITAGPPLTVAGVTVPAGGSALLVYEAAVTQYAPLGPAAQIHNTATVDSDALTLPVTASAAIPMEAGPDLTISKAVSPAQVTEGSTLTYTFVIQNSGAAPADAAAAIVVTDLFDPVLKDLTAALDGTPLTLGTDYTYTPAAGEFATAPGRITVPAAAYAQNAEGVWVVTPGETVLTVSGTV